MTPFDSNVDIWMRELTKAILQEMIEKAVGREPIAIPSVPAVSKLKVALSDRSWVEQITPKGTRD